VNYKKPRDKSLLNRKDIKFVSDVIYRNFEDGDMTLKEFKEYLVEKGYKTAKGEDITTPYIHTLLGYGHLPKHMGGNLLRIKMVRDVIAVRISEKTKEFYKNSGQYQPWHKKRGRKPGTPNTWLINNEDKLLY
jgi:hypothetical protein